MPEPIADQKRAEDGFALSLFKEYAGDLHAFLVRRMGSRERADDIFQTVFERVLKVRKADLVQQPHAYLFGIAFHVVREFWIREKRDAALSFDSAAVQQADRSLRHASADDAAERLNLRCQLDRALAALPENHRKVLLACKRDGMSYEEASLATGISHRDIPAHGAQVSGAGQSAADGDELGLVKECCR
jgi:RNA polymerase sigma factor (sigma-70 family)